MQNIENDMDDLFRKAAKKYPLNPGQTNWESVEKKLSAVEVSDGFKKPERINNYKKSGLLLLLIFISLTAGFLILNPVLNNYQAGINDKQIDKQINQNRNNNPLVKDKIHASQLAGKVKINRAASKDEKPQILPVSTPLERNKIHSITQAKNRNKNIFLNKSISKPPTGIDQQNSVIANQKPENTETERNLKYSKTENKTPLPETGEKKPVVENKMTLDKNLSSTEKKKVPSAAKRVKENSFYAGISLGTDFSRVKSSAFNNPGIGAGIIAGYILNKTLFIETGFFSDTKYYSSDGKMFDMKSASMPDNMIVNDLESRSKIVEIPVKIGYRFNQKKNMHFFVTAGFAAYIVTKEKNNYNVTMNGNPEKMEGIYTKNNLKLPAVVNISAGLEKNISPLLKVRIEPYLKLPVQGIGVGKLPVTSAGIQVEIISEVK